MASLKKSQISEKSKESKQSKIPIKRTIDFDDNNTLHQKIEKLGSNKKLKHEKDDQTKLIQIATNLKSFRKELPIWKERNLIIDSIRNNDTIVIIGEMGSGKSTQIPQFLMEIGMASKGCCIAITQPRRVAAMSLAKRVAQEVGTTIGHKVGYSVRFDDATSRSTLIKYLTDGMLLRELLMDPLLKNYSVVILDEAHERTVRTDILFGMVKRAQAIRSKMIDDSQKGVSLLKIIIMSATLDAKKFANYFNTSTILSIPGRQFPVTVHNTLEPQDDYLDAALITTFQIHTEQPPGDILIFLPGQEDIETLEKLINDYGTTLPPDKLKQQTKVFDPAPPGSRKVILATNIAETSITIRGAAGFCYRLYTEEEFQKMEEDTVPEIKRCNLASVILLLKALGIDNVLDFEYLDSPPRNSLTRALEQLYLLKALDNKGIITDLGRRMAEFPLEPAFARVLLASKELACTREAISIISLLSVDSIFFTPQDKRDQATETKKKFASPLGDLITLLNVLHGYQDQNGNAQWCRQNFINKRNMKIVLDVQNQLIPLCNRIGISNTVSCGIDYDRLIRCLLNGFIRNTAMLQPNNTYKTICVSIHPSSVMCNKKVEAVMYTELVLTSRPYMKYVTLVQTNWLQEMMSSSYSSNLET
ncbi:8284_t:CDS:10 [Ambispora gerdemannii]|uniref:RNA helicase n=1 Tax=Ambispora gerdemannii TaxID=144530 RepID=A0A9N9B3W5_9GLOM|nr:8284_t:CDS:10 [Ambispora gerdemannii]